MNYYCCYHLNLKYLFNYIILISTFFKHLNTNFINIFCNLFLICNKNVSLDYFNFLFNIKNYIF